MTHPLACRCLDCSLMRLRMLLRSEVPLQMTQHATPVLRGWDGVPDNKDPDEGGIGPPLTAALHRYLAGPDHWGTSRLGMLSIIEISDWCASRHPPHRRPMFTRTLCAQLVFEVARPPWPYEIVELPSRHPDLSLAQITGMLSAALTHAEDWRGTMFARWTKVPGAEEPLPERRRVA